jgi:Amino acid permease
LPATDPDQPHLKRVLGRADLVLLFVVAIFNLNVVPSIAANGGVTVWLWIVSLILFFWPQGIAVIELAHRYPGEGGVYLWAKEVFGDFHGFLSGWCYWTNNMLYVPTVMLYFVGVSVFVLGPNHQALADNKPFALIASLLLLVVLVVLNIVGLGVGKWVNNLGGIGTGIAAATLIGLGLVIWLRFGTTVSAADFRIPANPRFVLNSFGVICFGLVGLELASVMGDEIQDPRRTLPGAVAWGGVLSGLLYIGATLTLLIAVSKDQISVLQGIVQAVGTMATRVFGVAGWLGAHSVCRRSRFVHAGVDGEGAPTLCDSLCRAHRSRRGFDGADRDEFCGRRRAGNFPEDVVAGSSFATDTVSIHVCGTHQAGPEYLFRTGPLQQDDVDACRHQRTGDHHPGDCAGIFSGTADQFVVVL